MTTVPQDMNIRTHRMSERDARIALDRVVRRSGYTLPELRQQARNGEFQSLRARLAWIAVQALEGA